MNSAIARTLIVLFALSALAAAATPCKPGVERRKLKQAALQNLQVAKVNSGKELWRLEAARVAAREAASLDSAYKGDPEKVPVKQLRGDDKMQVFSYTGADRTLEITVKKFDWLLPYSGIWKMMMWTVSDVKTKCK